MSHTLSFRKTSPPNSTILAQMFRLRHEVFHNRLGWAVDSINGLEIDQFDREENPLYVVSQGQSGGITGCGRVLPTTGPYMIEMVFSELLRGEPLPKDPAVWEISRLATTSHEKDNPQLSLCRSTFGILQEGFSFAEQNGITHFVFVTSVAIERLLTRTGLILRRFGDQKAVRVGKVLSVACWIEISDDNRQVLFSTPDIAERAA